MAPKRGTATKRKRLFGRPPTVHGSFAMVNPQRAMMRTPAIKTVGELKKERVAQSLNRDVDWQREAYEMCNSGGFTAGVGEAAYVMHLTANTVSLCGLPVMQKTAAGDIPAEDQRVLSVMDNLQPPRGGQKEIKRRLALHGCIAGEWYLLGTRDTEGVLDLGILWEALSVLELTINGAGRVERNRDGSQRAELGEDCYVGRGWLADAAFSDRADSQMRRALPVCREIAVHSRVIESSSVSRIAAGLLFVPEEMTIGDDDDDDEGDLSEDDALDAITEQLMRHLAEPIGDQLSPARFVPLVMRGPGEMGQYIRLIELAPSFDTTADDLRDKGLRRLARQLDIPPEMLEGKSGLSGLGGGNVAKQVDDDFVVKHVVPLGEALADFLTVVYLRPMLIEFEGFTPEQATQFFLGFDTTPVTGERDREGSGRALYDRTLLSDEVMVTAAGFEPADMPSEPERVAREALALVQKSPNLAPALLPLVPGFENADFSKIVPAASRPGAPSPQPAPAPAAGLVDRLAVAADAAVDRALERAGTRLVNAAQHDLTLRDRLQSVRKQDACTMVGPEELARFAITDDILFRGVWDAFALKARAWLRVHLESDGYPDVLADETATRAVDGITGRLTDLVKVNLHRGLPMLGNGLRVPTELVEDAVRDVVVLPVAVG